MPGTQQPPDYREKYSYLDAAKERGSLVRRPNLDTTAMPESCDSSLAMNGRTKFLTGALVAAALSGCASDDGAGRFLVQPGKYVLYSCKEIAETTQAISIRQQELERLMAKAGVDSGGRFVSDLAYRPEDVQLRGQMNELRKASAEKNCKFSPAAGPGPHVSDQVIR